ncbi:hypothetical protein JCM10449v2_000635 [Rhodotorula kratochvilovae]
METDEQKRERQSKALGAAFLAHQVSELERSVDTLAFSRDPRLYGCGGGRGGRGGRGGAGGGRQAKREVRVVDASALVHALPVLKRWIREDAYQLVVPLSALSTLDLLKKAPEPLHELAREATRFLETQLNIARQIQGAFSPADADERTRLRAQAQSEELSWAEVEKLFKVPEDWVVELPAGVELPPPEEGEEPAPLPLPTVNDIPLHLRSTLQCILHFYTCASSSSSDPPSPVAVTYDSLLPTPAPLAAPLAKLVSQQTAAPSSPRKRRDPSSASSAPEPPKADYLALSSGDALAFYLATFFPSVRSALYTISSAEVHGATGWLRALAQQRQQSEGGGERGGRGGRGGGRGRGGRGGGGGGGRGGRGGGKGAAGGDAPKSLFVP